MLKRFLLAVLIAALALSSFCASAAPASYGSEFLGFFEHVVNIRANPGDQKGNVGTIPAYTPVTLKPVSSAYAEVTYEGAHGYVYTGQVMVAPACKDIDPYILTAPGNKVVWKLWTEGAGSSGSIPAGTPILITQIWGDYYRAFTVQYGSGYIHKRDTVESVKGVALTGSVFSDEDANVYELPFESAPVKTLLQSGQKYNVVQLLNGYYQIKLEDGTDGYVLESDAERSAATAPAPAAPANTQQTITIPSEAVQTPAGPAQDSAAPAAEPEPEPAPEVKSNVVYIAQVNQATSFFTAPNRSNETMESITKSAVAIVLTPSENGFFYWAQKNVYVDGSQLDIWEAKERDGSMLIYCTIDVPLLQLPDSAAGKLGYTLVGGQAYDARYEMNDYYVIPVTSDGQLGFIMKSAEGVFEVAKSRTVD